MNFQKDFIKLLSFIFVIAVFVGACDDSDSSSTLVERDFVADPTLTADPEDDTIIKFLESPNTNQTNTLDFIDPGDTGGKGFDTIPFSYKRTLEHTFCWEDDDGEAGHFIELDDTDGNNIFRLDVNGECITEIIEAGDYILKIFHDGLSGTTHPIFFIPDPDELEQPENKDDVAGLLFEKVINALNNFPGISIENAFAQTATPKETLVTTRKCIACDLRRVDLSFLDLQNVDLSGSRLNSSNLSNANFTGSEFTSAKLQNSDMNDSDFVGADFTSANLTSADLTDSNFDHGDFKISTLDSVVFTGANFSNAIWTDGVCTCSANNIYIGDQTTDSLTIVDSISLATVVTIILNDQPGPMEFSPDGSFLYIAERAGTLTIVNTKDNTLEYMLSNILGDSPLDIAVTPDGSKLYATNSSGINVIDLDNKILLNSINIDGVYGITITPDGSRVYVTIRSQGTTDMDSVLLLDPSTLEQISSTKYDGTPSGIVPSPDGSKVYVSNSTSIAVIDISINGLFEMIPLSSSLTGHPNNILISSEGSKIYVRGNNFVSVVDTTSSTEIDKINFSTSSGSTAFGLSPDNSTMYVSDLRDLILIDLSTNTFSQSIMAGVDLESLAVSPIFPSVGECVGCQ